MKYAKNCFEIKEGESFVCVSKSETGPALVCEVFEIDHLDNVSKFYGEKIKWIEKNCLHEDSGRNYVHFEINHIIDEPSRFFVFQDADKAESFFLMLVNLV